MLDLQLVKQHLRVDHDDDDPLIEAYIAGAVSAFESWTNRTLYAEGGLPDPVGNAIALKPGISQGMFLLVGHWYANRESVATGTIATEVPLATASLWRPHRWVNL
tara:strand:+ start:10703 stop:11017 length:315 start_codon:yes stop_codon:yes gene_type:complete